MLPYENNAFCVASYAASVQVREDQEELLAQQDAGLDMLHDIVVRQKGMGQQIFREVAVISKPAIHQLTCR